MTQRELGLSLFVIGALCCKLWYCSEQCNFKLIEIKQFYVEELITCKI